MPARQNNSSNLFVFPGCDPQARLTTIFFTDQINNKAELVILNWLVSLPTAIDPAFAAKSVLIKLEAEKQKPSADQKSLLTLLHEIANHPRQRLLDLKSKSHRDQRRKNWLRHTQQRTFF